MAAQTSTNQNFLAFKSQEELQIWNIELKSKCLIRLKSLSKESPITAFAFSQLQDNVLSIGHKDGNIVLYDCLKCQVIKQTQICQSPIISIRFFNKQNQLIANTSQSGFILELHPNIKIVDQWQFKKNSPDMLQVSTQDSIVLECCKNQFQLRDVKTKQLIKTEAGSVDVCYWIDKEYYVTASKSEITLWSIKDENPISLLDTGRSEPIIILASKVSSKGRFSIAAASKQACNIFKLNFTTPKKTILPFSRVEIPSQDSFYQVKMISNTAIHAIHGSVFNIISHQVVLQDGTFSLGQAVVQQAIKQQKINQEVYNVQDAVMTDHNFPQKEIIIPQQTKVQNSNSLTIVLQQALQSDDNEQLQWIIKQTEQSLLTNTVRALKTEFVVKLFKQILFLFQSEQSEQQIDALQWLRVLIQEHWNIIITQPAQNLSQLFQIQGFIKKKTCNLQKFCQLQGKLEMAVKVVQIKQVKQQAVLVYKDASDDDQDFEQDDEEIKEIPLGQEYKRRDVIQYGDEDEEEIDDSVESSSNRSEKEESEMDIDDEEAPNKIASSDQSESNENSEDSEIIRRK